MRKKIELSKETIDSLNYIKNQLKAAFADGNITKEVYRQYTFATNKILYADTDPMFEFNNSVGHILIDSISCPFCNKELSHTEWVYNKDTCMYCDSKVIKIESESPYVKR